MADNAYAYAYASATGARLSCAGSYHTSAAPSSHSNELANRRQKHNIRLSLSLSQPLPFSASLRHNITRLASDRDAYAHFAQCDIILASHGIRLIYTGL